MSQPPYPGPPHPEDEPPASGRSAQEQPPAPTSPAAYQVADQPSPYDKTAPSDYSPQHESPQDESRPGHAYGHAPQPGQAAHWQPPYIPAHFSSESGFTHSPKSRTLPIALVGVAVVLVLAVGGSIAILLAGDDEDTFNDALTSATATPTAPSPDGATAAPSAKASRPAKAAPDPQPAPTRAKPTSAAPATTAPRSIRIVEPKTLGGRPKVTDTSFAKLAKQLEDSFTSMPGVTSTASGLYGTFRENDIVMMTAAKAPIDDPEGELDQAFYSVGEGEDRKLRNVSSAPTGKLGGSALCGSTEASGIDIAVCSWADHSSVGTFIWYYKSASKAKAEFAALRAQVEKKG